MGRGELTPPHSLDETLPGVLTPDDLQIKIGIEAKVWLLWSHFIIKLHDTVNTVEMCISPSRFLYRIVCNSIISALLQGSISLCNKAHKAIQTKLTVSLLSPPASEFLIVTLKSQFRVQQNLCNKLCCVSKTIWVPWSVIPVTALTPF